MPTASKAPKLTVTIDDQDLTTAIRDAAAEEAKPVRAIVAEALRQWLKRREELEDICDIAAAEKSRQDSEPTISLEEYAKRRGWRA